MFKYKFTKVSKNLLLEDNAMTHSLQQYLNNHYLRTDKEVIFLLVQEIRLNK